MKYRTTKSLLTLLVGTLAINVAACGDEDGLSSDDGDESPTSFCESICERRLACTGGEADVGCNSACAYHAKVAPAADCQASYTAYLDCTDEAFTSCDLQACNAETSAYSTCVSQYCFSTNPSDPACTPPTTKK